MENACHGSHHYKRTYVSLQEIHFVLFSNVTLAALKTIQIAYGFRYLRLSLLYVHAIYIYTIISTIG